MDFASFAYQKYIKMRSKVINIQYIEQKKVIKGKVIEVFVTKRKQVQML